MKRMLPLLLIVFLISPVLSNAEYAPDYFPLTPGNSWMFRVSNNMGISTAVWNILPGVVNINGVDTRVLSDSKNGEYMYLTSDLNGVMQHGTYSPATATLPAITQTFNPPVKYANAHTSVGSQVHGYGVMNVDIFGYGTYSFNYYADSNVAAFESVIVPAGTFAAIKFVLDLHASTWIYGQPVSEDITQTFWLAKGVGLIKQTTTDSLGSDVYELTSTNVVYTIPDPFTFAAQIDVPLSTAVISNPITVTGITAAAGISITGGEYRIGNGAWTSGSGTVTNGQTVTVRLTSAAAVNTQTTATLTIGGVSAGFRVITIGPRVALSPPFLRLIEPTLGATSAPQTVTVTNTGSAPLTINAITLPPDFAETNSCTGSIAVGGTCTIDVTFTPTRNEIRKGPLMILSNAASSPHMERILGVGGVVPPNEIGIFRQGAWYFDRDQSGGWSGCGPDTCVNSFGGFAADIPVLMSVMGAEGSGTWAPMTPGVTDHLTGVYVSWGNDVFAVGSRGMGLLYYGSMGTPVWTALNSGTTDIINGVWGPSGNNVFAVGVNGMILYYNMNGWFPVSSGTTRTLLVFGGP
jgi:hypothetical protein